MLKPKQVYIKAAELLIEKMYIYPQNVSFHDSLYGQKLLYHGQIWYHLIGNFMRNNFSKKYFMYM